MANPQDVYIEYSEHGFTCDAIVSHLGGNRYRLEDSGALTPVSYRDVFEADRKPDGTLLFRRIVERSTWRQFAYLLPRSLVERADELDSILDSVSDMGGHWERVFGGILYIAVPPDVEYDPTADLRRLAGPSGITQLDREDAG